MKKLFMVAALAVMSLMSAQTEQGKTYVGLNSTGLGFSTVKDSGVRNFNVGAEVGHFVEDKLAAVAGLGYTNTYVKGQGTIGEEFRYLVGGKYFIEGVAPVQVDFNGTNNGDNYIGTQLGYAFYPASNFSVEPRVRMDWGMNKGKRDTFSAGIGFGYHF